jgi:glutathione S-transferase
MPTTSAPLKLFYSPGACSLASHIALEEAGAAFAAVLVDFKATEQRSAAYLTVNPKGRVPALVTSSPHGDWTLTENPAILQYIAQSHPAANLWPTDLQTQAKCLEWMAWLSSGVHVTYAHVRRAERYATSEAALADVRATGLKATRAIWADVETKLGQLSKAGVGPWIAGEQFTVVDPYVFTFWTWGRGSNLGYDMAKDFPAWTAHAKHMLARPAVQRVHAREGLPL